MNHEVIWTQPPALLSSAARLMPTPRAAIHAPAILRFASDTFMQDLLDLLQVSPERLGEYRVRRETWRGFSAAPVRETPRPPSRVLQRLGILPPTRVPVPAAPPDRDRAASVPVKLYQAAHQRHYLITCSLVCQVAGLPDRRVEPGQGEQAACVVRRLLPPAGDSDAPVEAWEEHAWVPGANGTIWQRLGSDRHHVHPAEERLPLFAVHFAENGRRQRRLFAGVIPVGRREAYLGAPRAAGGSAAGVTRRTSRRILLRKDVIEPWKALVRRAQDVRVSFVGPFTGEDRAPNASEKAQRLRLEREQIQTVSWLVLLDFAKYLAAYLKPVWRAVLDPGVRESLSAPELDLFEALETAGLSGALRERLRHDHELSAAGNALYPAASVPSSLRQALARYGSGIDGIDRALERQLEAVDQDYQRLSPGRRALWPDFLFPLADPDMPAGAPMLPSKPLGTLTLEERGEFALDENPDANDPLERVDRLGVLVLRALRDDEAEPAPEPAVPVAAIQPANAFAGVFVMRCVFERPGCEPLHASVVSEPTERFEMAGFFDPDAPARPIRIGLPIDTTPAGLRKFDRNTAFVISDTLCGQIRRVRGLSLADLVLSVLPWPLHKDLPVGSGGPCQTDAGLSLGMICSFSIPIITLCALLLLMIMVSLLDFIFRWMAWFAICFPIPGLKAKSQGSST